MRVGGVKYTIKDGIVYDAQEAARRRPPMVREAKEKDGKDLSQPGIQAPPLR